MSSLGQSLLNARKNAGLTQEAVAEHLGVSRQTISKWELDETLPDIRQAKALSGLYHTTLDELIDYDAEVQEIQRIVRHTSEETQQKIDWTKLWGEMYPVLLSYPQQVDVERYKEPLKALIGDLEREQGYFPARRLPGAQGHPGQTVDRRPVSCLQPVKRAQKSLPIGRLSFMALFTG